MSKTEKTYSGLICAAIFILLEIATLGMLKRSSTLQNIWINRFSHRVMAACWGSGETLRNHFSLEKQNAALELENHELREQLREYRLQQDAVEENAAGAELKDRNFRYTPATVTKISRNTAHNYIIINKGSADGIKPHCGIVTTDGVVGIISAVDKHYSYGLTLMNANISVSSRIGKTGIVSPLVWDGRHSNRAILKDVPLHYSVEPGDTVYTSGFSSIFPPDIPIGVTGGSRLVDGVTNNTDVTLFEDFSALRYVTIVENPSRTEVDNLEMQQIN